MGLQPSKALLERGERAPHWRQERERLYFGLERVRLVSIELCLKGLDTSNHLSAGHDLLSLGDTAAWPDALAGKLSRLVGIVLARNERRITTPHKLQAEARIHKPALAGQVAST